MKTLQDFFIAVSVVDIRYRRSDEGQLIPDESGQLVPVGADDPQEVYLKAAAITRYGSAQARLAKFGIAGMVVHEGALFYTAESPDEIREALEKIEVLA